MKLEKLLSKPVYQMTGEELLFIQNASRPDNGNFKIKVAEGHSKQYEYGIRGIAKIFGCSTATANRIKKSGRIDLAITQIGRKIIIDVDLALELVKSGKGKYHRG